MESQLLFLGSHPCTWHDYARSSASVRPVTFARSAIISQASHVISPSPRRRSSKSIRMNKSSDNGVESPIDQPIPVNVPAYSRRLFLHSTTALLLSTSIPVTPSYSAPLISPPTTTQGTTPIQSYLSSYPIPPELQSIASKVKTFSLPNGFRFVVLERHISPTIAFVTLADVGAVDEEDGKTGTAHFLEHLAFKGTTKIGTRNWMEEQKVMGQLATVEKQRSELYRELYANANANTKPSSNVSMKTVMTPQQQKQLRELEAQIEVLESRADQYIEPNEFSKVLKNQGGVNENASTTADSTNYYYSLPSNKLELWFALESQRFKDPVFRQFNREKKVVLEERKLRVDNASIGKFLEQFCDTAFDVHPYRRPTIGYEKDLLALSRADVEEFFQKHYVPDRLCFCIVGDVEIQQIQELAHKYFGDFKQRDPAARSIPTEPVQQQPKLFRMDLNSEPWYAVGFHVPEWNNPQTPSMDVITSILSGGRTSRFYKHLVQDRALALDASFTSGFPGDKYPSLGVALALPTPSSSIQQVSRAIDEQLHLLSVPGNVKPEEILRVKKVARTAVFKLFQSNESMASVLAQYTVRSGDPLNAFRSVSALDEVSVESIQQLASTMFVETNKTAGSIE